MDETSFLRVVFESVSNLETEIYLKSAAIIERRCLTVKRARVLGIYIFAFLAGTYDSEKTSFSKRVGRSTGLCKLMIEVTYNTKCYPVIHFFG